MNGVVPMPLTASQRLRATSSLSVAISAVATVSLAVLVWAVNSNIRDASEWIAHVAAVRLVNQEIIKGLLRAESAQRGYLVTLQQDYASAHEDAVKDVTGALADLRRLAADDRVQRDNIEQFASVAERRLDLLEDALQAAQQGNQSEAFDIVALGRSRAVMRDATVLAASIDQEEARQADLHEARLAGQRRLELLLALALVLLSTGLVVAVARGVSAQVVLVTELRDALENVRTLSGMLPICARCKKIRDDGGYWQRIEKYLSEHTDATFSHGICPSCVRELYPEVADEVGVTDAPGSAGATA